MTGIYTGTETVIPSSYWGKSHYDIAVNRNTQASGLILYKFAVTLNKADNELIDALQVESNTETDWTSVEKTVDGLTINIQLVGNINKTGGYKLSRSDGGEIIPGLQSQVIVAYKDAQDYGKPGGYGVWEHGTKVFPL